jgi:hypothetical protein
LTLRFERVRLSYGDAGVRLVVRAGEAAASYGEFLTALAASSEARAALTRALAEVPFAAFAWECRGVSSVDLDAPMDMVAIEIPRLATSVADPAPFRDHLAQGSGSPHAVRFENLGRDAELVVPRNVGPDEAYAHLARFVREAPAEQTNGFWRDVAEAVRARLEGGRRVWLSTAGLGVAWLHVRLDDSPKYYRHAAFAE